MTEALDALLTEAEGRVAPAISAAILVDGREVYAFRPDRVFDLASLTKPLCTAEVAMRMLAEGRIALDAGHPLLPAGVTIRHLLQHASGWPAWLPLYEKGGRSDVIAAALAEPLVAAPGAVHCYSDIGFLGLGAVLEAVGGARIDALWRGSLPWSHAASEPTDGGRGGPVNDQNARAMGGIAPHAGLFGDARAVAAAAHRWLTGEIPWAERAFSERGPGTHALGWDTPSPGGASSAGPNPPADAVGHLGFTGTSVWMSPSRRIVAVLLTNRVALGSDLTGIRALRPAFHQRAWDA
jgi:CubicO group peptidase (beta-lactamase class C family)